MELSCKAFGRRNCTTKRIGQFTMKADDEHEAERLAELFWAIQSGRVEIVPKQPPSQEPTS